MVRLHLFSPANVPLLSLRTRRAQRSGQASMMPAMLQLRFDAGFKRMEIFAESMMY